MTHPVRVQLSRRKGWRMAPSAVRVSRPGPFANPFSPIQVGVFFFPPSRDLGKYLGNIVQLRTPPSRERCIDMYIAWLLAQCNQNPDFLDPLRGKNLACWCPLDQPCHADVLLDLANR